MDVPRIVDNPPTLECEHFGMWQSFLNPSPWVWIIAMRLPRYWSVEPCNRTFAYKPDILSCRSSRSPPTSSCASHALCHAPHTMQPVHACLMPRTPHYATSACTPHAPLWYALHTTLHALRTLRYALHTTFHDTHTLHPTPRRATTTSLTRAGAPSTAA